MNLERVCVLGGFHTQEYRYSLHKDDTEQVVHRRLNNTLNDLNRDKITIISFYDKLTFKNNELCNPTPRLGLAM